MSQRKFNYDRFFGDNIDPRIREKLDARQRLQKGVDFGKSNDQSLAGTPYGETKGALDLSQRIPWARMWTAIESYELSPSMEELKEISQDPKKMASWEYESKTVGVKVYAIGNQSFNDYQTNSSTGSVVGNLLKNNQFLKPNAGIISVNSSTTGYMGAVTETVITFKIYNYADWENVFVPFFMVPGATVFLDWGWNTADIYNPVSLLEGVDDTTGGVAGDFKFKSFRELIYGAEGNSIGLLSKSRGDLNVIRGRVTKFNSTVAADGSFDCTINLVSENYALIDYDQTTGIHFPTIFENKIAADLLKRIKDEFGIDIKEEDVINSDKLKRMLPMYVGPNQQVNFMGEDGPKFALMSDKAIESGIFYRSIDDVKVDEVKKNVKGLSTSNQTYITFNKFADLLNEAIGIKLSSNPESGDDIKYDFEYGEITFNSTLYARQIFQGKLSKQLTFMYPTKVTHGYTEQKTENESEVEVEEDLILNNSTNLSKVKSVPIKDVWINLDLIYKIFKKHTSIKEAVNQLLVSINEDSLGIFNLRLEDRGPNALGATDINYSTPPNQTTTDNTPSNDPNNPTDNSPDTFVFSVFSPNTIINSLDLQMTLENNALANKMAIQGMNAGSLVYPLSSQLRKDLATRDINNSVNENNLFYRHIPSQTQDADQDFMKNTLEDTKSKEDEEISELEKQKAAEIETTNIQTLFNMVDSPWKGVSEQTKADEAAKGPSAYQRKNKETPTLDDPKSESKFPEDLYVGSINNYFNLKMLGESITTKFQDIIMPYTVSFSIYGISGLFPGNKFHIDYLPKKYREKTYFIIMKISHSLSTQGWTTEIEGQMRYYGEKELDNTILYNPNINVSKKKLWNMGYTTEQVDEIRASNKEFWTVVPEYSKMQKKCLDMRAMNYAPVDKWKWDCAGTRNGDDLSCCKYCPDGGAEVKDGWKKNQSTGNCENEFGITKLNPYLSWIDPPPGYEFQPGTGWVATDGTVIDNSSSGTSTQVTSQEPIVDNGTCDDRMASNYEYTADMRFRPLTEKDADGNNRETFPGSGVFGPFSPCEDRKCCKYYTPVEMWEKYKTHNSEGKLWAWEQYPVIYYTGYSGNVGNSGQAGYHCRNYDSTSKWSCAYGACGGGSQQTMWSTKYPWPGKGGTPTLREVLGYREKEYSGIHGILYGYENSQRGLISDIFESVGYCRGYKEMIDWRDGNIADEHSQVRWGIAQYRACASSYPEGVCTDTTAENCYFDDGWKDKMKYYSGSNGNYMALFKKLYQHALSKKWVTAGANLETIASWVDSGTSSSNTTDWNKCFYMSDFGTNNDYGECTVQDIYYNLGCHCISTTDNPSTSTNTNIYHCADNSCCSW